MTSGVQPSSPERPAAERLRRHRTRNIIAIAAIAVVAIMIAVVVLLAFYGAPALQGNASTITYASFLAANVPPAGVTVVNSTNSIYVNQTAVTIMIVSAPQWANHTGEFFMCYGLINPTFYFRMGMMERFALINADNQTHNLLITGASPPYPYRPMGTGGTGMMWQNQYNWMYCSQFVGGLNGTLYQNTFMHMVTMQTQFKNTGTFWYMSGYPGDAQSGMFGRVIVGS